MLSTRSTWAPPRSHNSYVHRSGGRDSGLAIQYGQYDTISHFPGGMLWLPGALIWIDDRFNGKPASSNCADIAPAKLPCAAGTFQLLIANP